MSDFEKPSTLEDEYFAREDIEKLHRLAHKQAAELATHQKEELKKLHFMHCPKCGMTLHTLKRGRVAVEACFNCDGIWLDKGHLEALMAEGNGSPLTAAVLNIFRRST